MSLLYIALNQTIIEILHFKRQQRYSLISIAIFMLLVILTLIFYEELEIFKVSFLKIVELKSLILYITSFLIAGFFEQRFQVNNLKIMRLLTISMALHFFDVEMPALLVSIFLIFYENIKRNEKINSVVVSKTQMVIPLLVIFPIVQTFNLVNISEILLGLTICLLLVLDFYKMSIYRIFALLLLCKIHFVITGRIELLLVMGTILNCFILVGQFLGIQLVRKRDIENNFVGRFLTRLILGIEAREKPLILKNKKKINLKKSLRNLEYTNQKNDLMSTMLFWVLGFSLFSLFVIARSL